jgi:hypothetical protein
VPDLLLFLFLLLLIQHPVKRGSLHMTQNGRRYEWRLAIDKGEWLWLIFT